MDKLNYLDIGAANFRMPQEWAYFENSVRPILFEPDLRSFEELKKQGYSVYNVALGATKETKEFYLTRKPACSSVYKPNMKYLSNFPNVDRWHIIKTLSMNVAPLDDLNIDAHFIKIDTQGSELDILKGAKKTLSNVLGLEIEVSFHEIYENQPLFEDVKNFLKDLGFNFYDFITEYRYNRLDLNRTGQLAFADALFLRDPDTIKEKDSTILSHYNIICNVYKKFDLIIP